MIVQKNSCYFGHGRDWDSHILVILKGILSGSAEFGSNLVKVVRGL